MRLLRRMSFLAAAALITGLLVNRFYREGIPPGLLMLTLSPGSGQDAWRPISADSAFFYFAGRSALFLDIREPEDYSVDHIPGAIPVPFFSFFRDPPQVKQLDRSSTIVLCGQDPLCRKERLMAQALLKSGFRSVLFLRNGYKEWLNYGFPVEAGKSP